MRIRHKSTGIATIRETHFASDAVEYILSVEYKDGTLNFGITKQQFEAFNRIDIPAYNKGYNPIDGHTLSEYKTDTK